MFTNTELQEHLENSSTIRLQSAVIAEWNMNIAENISKLGNYRYRPNDAVDTKYNVIAQSYDVDDAGNFYTDATDADVLVDGGFDDQGIPLAFISKKEKDRMLYSLEDCFGRFRPRSGVNKLRYFENKYSHHDTLNIARRPRYYMADKKDKFKYWSSYRTENGLEKGIANFTINGKHYIEDAAPFVVYTSPVPANRIVVKMQTNVGDVDLGPFSSSSGTFDDPLYGTANQTTPIRWSIQYLQDGSWISAASFNEDSLRTNGTPIIGPNGYVELAYGLLVPEDYKVNFKVEKQLTSSTLLPSPSGLIDGTAYLVVTSATDVGTVHVVKNEEFETFPADYGWQLFDELSRATNFVTDLTSPPTFTNDTNMFESYREFANIQGLRVVVSTMNKFDSTFDLIELSPRLAVDLSDKVTSFSINKNASDLGVSGLPVGQLLASAGSLDLFDFDQAFFKENTNSIIANYTSQNAQIKLYEIVIDVNGADFFIPIKTMYSEGFPSINNSDRSVSLTLRDLFFYFESSTAPQILIQNASVSYAVSLLLDSIGFSNYVFLRNDGEDEEVIPYFFIEPDISVAEVLNKIARSAQVAMFFDEYNNFIIMSKNYIMPTVTERSTNTTLRGTKDFGASGIIKNSSTQNSLTNIIGIASQDNEVFNDGTITYATRYIQRSFSSIRQASLVDRSKTWIYKPVLLWEVSATENTRSTNDEISQQSSYALSAIPLASSLSASLPSVVNHSLVSNTIDVGEGAYWLTRYNGYFYANGEIIKYDAVQFNIPGLSATELAASNSDGDNVWISSIREYQKYFSKVPFNGKIYPTGLVRIYSEPNYETVSGITRLTNGAVSKHGRGQFGTTVVAHEAGVSDYWTSEDNVRGVRMDQRYLFGTLDSSSIETAVGAAGVDNTRAKEIVRTDLIKNFFASEFSEEIEKDPTYPATIQSSALVLNGTSFNTVSNPTSFVSYVYKPLENKFRHFGTRLRIVGKVIDSEIAGQSASGQSTYFTVTDARTDQSIAISGGSGGIAVMLNPETNNGYYFELAALTAINVSDYESDQNINNMFFYKIKQQSGDDGTLDAIPEKLWSGAGNVLVDGGKFTGQSRLSTESNPTVYDIAVEYQDIGDFRRFYLYVNNVIVGIVDDPDPLPVFNNMALFIRGSAKCMFENVYALTDNYSQNTTFSLDTPVNSVFGNDEINASKSFQRYAMSGLIQSTYLAGISASEPPKYNIYFEEFGTIMREAAYFDVRYDKAYPALSAKISPTFNRMKGYTISGFTAGSYGAEFLIFNNTDTLLNLDSTSGNYLRIQGVSFTQQSDHELSVDEYFEKIGNLSDPEISNEVVVLPPDKYKEDYRDIKLSRITQGKKAFSIEAPYIQSHDNAESLMLWLSKKIMKPRRSVGVEVFGMPTLQLGDIVEIDYTNENGVNEISADDSRFVVYSISYDRQQDGPKMTAYLSEVL